MTRLWTHSTWEVRSFSRRLREEVPTRHGILATDGTGLTRQRTSSVGVQRQCCGALGKVASCQVAVSTALIAGRLAWLTSMELYLPQAWMEDKDRRARPRWRPSSPMPLMEKLSSSARRAPLGVAYMVDVPYFVGRLTGTTVRESLTALANACIAKSRTDCWSLCQESSTDRERQYYFGKRRTHG